MTPDGLRAVAAAAQEVLARVPDVTAPVPAMGTDVAGVVGHVSSCLASYALDLAAGPVRVDAVRIGTRTGAPVGHLLSALGSAAEVLARTVTTAGPAERGWHEWGCPDPAGFTALGCAELLLHTDDVAGALGLAWTPPAPVVDATLTRLFPWVDPADAVAGPWAALRWATGRGELPGRDPVAGWRYHPAPLTEWDGRVPR
ncbi:hypothetical protein GB931_05470 [Modestobacter sp. I12A-02628]|uniref:Mycothiol-dependent maleylpyruvate isomerase metal-binding domain-containing protein n=1 Tax=Goekera deserti TaxID=2497753 RepID=A0A7K3WBB4_9ACTN|nr:hypothetical protein [Goekera deserti]MPQ97382.1 hypothetical protein [Goekera deserti]NDI48017.1 hypothetical protein [Goekera deserti]NEL53765.1 hypothetical protein [Goekera deserti]